ncbi:MAG TPA: hypothetical protein VNU93_05270 [Verrucomicrobiae bacterium]|nr:hypothetical protein [Verrucomicrobiae bacterium]
MLLKGARFVAYGAVMVAVGVILVLISTYTPVGRRVLFLVSGIPVLLFGRLAGFRGSLVVYLTTGLVLLFLVHPQKGIGYLLVAGGVPLLTTWRTLPLAVLGLGTCILSAAYLGIGIEVLQLPVLSLLAEIGPSLPVNPWLLACGLVVGLSFIYPWALLTLAREIEDHWVFKQTFQP